MGKLRKADAALSPEIAFLLGGNPTDFFNEQERELLTLDPAWAKAAYFWRTGIRFGHGRNMRVSGLGAVLGTLGVFKQRFEAGDALSLLHAIRYCAEENLPMPTWLARAFDDAFGRYQSVAGPHSLDEVFATPDGQKKTAQQRAAAKLDWDLGVQLYLAAWGHAKADESLTSINAVVVATLAKKSWGVGKTKARELILAADKSQSEHLEARTGGLQKQGLSQFLANRRKR
jgi:hypothetical protein